MLIAGAVSIGGTVNTPATGHFLRVVLLFRCWRVSTMNISMFLSLLQGTSQQLLSKSIPRPPSCRFCCFLFVLLSLSAVSILVELMAMLIGLRSNVVEQCAVLQSFLTVCFS